MGSLICFGLFVCLNASPYLFTVNVNCERSEHPNWWTILLCTVALARVSHSRSTTSGEQIIDKLMYKMDIDDLLMMQNFS